MSSPECANPTCDKLVGNTAGTQYANTAYCTFECWDEDRLGRMTRRVDETIEDQSGFAHGICKTCGWAKGSEIKHICPSTVHSPHQGSRYNQGKARFDLIPPEVITKLAEHYTYGANKYAPNNWRKGFPYSETSGSLLRHLYAWLAGERNDPESGNHHLTAVIWNAVTLLYFELFPEKYSKFDDRAHRHYEHFNVGKFKMSQGDMESALQVGIVTPPYTGNAPPTVPIPAGHIMMRDGDKIPQHAKFYNQLKDWETVPNAWVTQPYTVTMGPVIVDTLGE